MSALRSSWSGSSSSSGNSAMPIVTPIGRPREKPARRWSTASISFCASTIASSASATPVWITANSSPPSRATVSVARTAPCS
jgi:hypothetical protein